MLDHLLSPPVFGRIFHIMLSTSLGDSRLARTPQYCPLQLPRPMQVHCLVTHLASGKSLLQRQHLAKYLESIPVMERSYGVESSDLGGLLKWAERYNL